MENPKFRSSGVGHLMTEPKLVADKTAGNLSEGAKTHAIDVWVSWKYQRREDAYSKYLEKGNEVEEDAVTLVSLLTGIFYPYEPQKSFENDWLRGTPDLILYEKEGNPQTIEDTKSSWDIFTFQRAKNKGLNQIYYWQMQGYMWLTGATLANLRYCLVNATSDLIMDEKRRLAYAMRVIDSTEDSKYKKKCIQIERNMIYDMNLFRKHNPNFDLDSNLDEWEYDIPASERMFTIQIKRNDEDISRLKGKIEKAWEFMKTLD